MLAAVRAREISMFGDVSDGRGRDYFTRAAGSMRQHTFTELGADTDADIDADGRRMVFSSTRHNIYADLYIKSIDGVAVTQLTSDPSSDIQPSFSPSGEHVAFASDRSGNWDIWIISAEGGQPVQITDSPAHEAHPSWSVDGSQLVFCSLPDNGDQWELWITDAVRGPAKRFIGYGLFPEWSPVGDTILFQRARERGSNLFSIWTLSLIDGEPRYPTELASSAHQALIMPTWSPDGLRVAFAGVESLPPSETGPSATREVADIWLVGVDGRGKIRLTDGHTANYSPVFSPSGRVFFTTRRSGLDTIWSLLPAGPLGGGGAQLTGDLRRTPRLPETKSGSNGPQGR